jgi:hypothetical protein
MSNNSGFEKPACITIQSSRLSGPPVDMVLERLAEVQRFAIGGTGFAGTVSHGEQDYIIILSRTSAMADFEKLYAKGNPQAKCYALVGIRKLNPNRFKELAQPLRSSKELVATMHGCLAYQEVLEDVIKQIGGGRYNS